MNHLLKIENLNKIFNQGKNSEVVAVRDINLEINNAEIVMIMGPSGSGKTTLLTMIGTLLKPSTGKITMNGKEIQKLSSNKAAKFRRENFGFIFQSFNLLQNLSALENVLIADFNKQNSGERAKELLVKLGLEKRLHAVPNDLSGGERQRVAIARALINNPKLILADEPTANLDSVKGQEVMKLLCSISCEEERTIIIVSHDERIKDIAHRVIYIEDGKLIREEKGQHNTVCTMKKHRENIK